MGTIFQRKTKDKKTRYLARVRRLGGNFLARTFSTKAEAQSWIAAIETAIYQGTYSHVAESKKRTINQLIERYMQIELPKKPKSLEKQSQQLLWWKQHIGHYLLASVTPALLSECQEALLHETTSRGERRSPSTVNRYMSVLSHAFSVAYKHWQWVSHNPFRKIPKLKEPKGRDRILTEVEMATLLQACRQSSCIYLYLIVRIALVTGARKNEIMNLKWTDMDLIAGRAVLRDTKNGFTRALYLPSDIIAMLKDLRDKNKPSFLLFPGKDSSQPADIRTAWEFALKRAGITGFVFHSLRHHAASSMAAMGASDVELRTFLGHKSPSMVLRYAHYRESSLAHTINQMNQRIGEIEEHAQ